MGRNKQAKEAEPKVLRLGMILNDEMVLQKVLPIIRSFPGVDDCNVKKRKNEIKIIGSMDPAKLVEELQGITTIEILSSDKNMETTNFLNLRSAGSYIKDIGFYIRKVLKGDREGAEDNEGDDNGSKNGKTGSEREGGIEKREEDDYNNTNNKNNIDDKEKKHDPFGTRISSNGNFQQLRGYQQWTKNSRRVKIFMLCLYFKHRQHRLTAPPLPPPALPPPEDVM